MLSWFSELIFQALEAGKSEVPELVPQIAVFERGGVNIPDEFSTGDGFE
jgi:hypothetical protein